MLSTLPFINFSIMWFDDQNRLSSRSPVKIIYAKHQTNKKSFGHRTVFE